MEAGPHLYCEEKPNPSMWNWTGSGPNTGKDEAWEVRAFAEDAGGLMGTTWPPRSYACTFCRREFKSAQALGGHMNVHRRDRAKLRQSPQGSDSFLSAASSSSAHQAGVFPQPPPLPPPEFVANSSGVFLVYPISASTGAFFAPAMGSPPAFVSSPPYPAMGLSSSYPPACNDGISKEEGNDGVVVAELDLELRLGR